MNITREEQIAGIRRLADALEANSEGRIPTIYIVLYAEMAEARAIRSQMPHGWTKTNHKTSSYISYTKQFCNNADSWEGVQYVIEVAKTETCQRVQVGTKHVEAVEAHDEPVYEWQCGPETDGDES